MMNQVLIGLIAFGAIIAFRLLRPAITMKKRAILGVTFAKPIYSDQKGTKLLVAPKLDLQGKPDYIFQKHFTGNYVPLEIKSGIQKKNEPYPGDVMQLVTYFLIIEEIYGKRPKYGKLVYKNKTFNIRNTRKLRKTCKTQIKKMRGMLKGRENDICVEPSFVKCRNCVCSETVCEFKGD